jgi:4-hydroxy-2-oxoheptanedioate aldolase
LIRKNPLKSALKAGRLTFGLYSSTLDVTLVEIMGREGVDFVILDTEHTGFGIEDCRASVLAAEVAGVTPLIRVYDNNPGLINKALEIGALGVVVPHVDTAEQARLAVQATLYPPDGVRGVHPGTRAAGFSKTPDEWDAIWKMANQEIVTVLQPLESLAGIDNLEEIVSTPGVDLVSLGLGDLSQVLGCPMRSNDGRLKEIHEKALGICQKKGVAAYALIPHADAAREWREKGVHTFVLGSDTGLFQKGVRQLVGDMGRSSKETR